MKLILRVAMVIAIVAMGGYVLGLWSADDLMMGRWRKAVPAGGQADTGAARDRLNRLDEQAGRAVQRVDDFVTDGGLSGKIKSKMALDDVVRARAIEVSTTDGVVTLAGTVRSVVERDQAVRLARNTTGVTQVVDRLVILP